MSTLLRSIIFQRPGCEARLARFAAGPLKNEIDRLDFAFYKHATPTGFSQIEGQTMVQEKFHHQFDKGCDNGALAVTCSKL